MGRRPAGTKPAIKPEALQRAEVAGLPAGVERSQTIVRW